MVVVKLLSVNRRFNNREAFCKESNRRNMQASVGYCILCSGHKLQFLDLVKLLLFHPVGLVDQRLVDGNIGGPPIGPSASIQFKVEGEG